MHVSIGQVSAGIKSGQGKCVLARVQVDRHMKLGSLFKASILIHQVLLVRRLCKGTRIRHAIRSLNKMASI